MSKVVVMRQFFTILTHLICPPYCVGCQTILSAYTVLCTTCADALPKIFSLRSPLSPSRDLVVHAFTAYQKPIERLIQAKFTRQRVPVYQLGFLLAQYAQKMALESDYIVPIPLHWTRKIWRGFNQSEILAHAVADAVKKPVIFPLVRHKYTVFQVNLSADERKKNLERAFKRTSSYSDERLKNKRILLIDDLYTTGATAQAAARELYRHGVASVELLVVCRVTD